MTVITPRVFRQKPFEIEAIQYTGNNIGEIAEWVINCQVGNQCEFKYNGNRLTVSGDDFCACGEPGNWLIRDPGTHFDFYSDKHLHRFYDEVNHE